MSLWQLWILALFLKLLLLPVLPITPDEAYYFVWARHLQLSYFDHPPAVAWIMWFAQWFWKTPFGIRLPGVILGHAGLLPWFFILKKLKFNERTISFWLLAMLLGPLTGLGSFIVTPDLPLLVFWSLAVWAALLVIARPDFSRWFLLGTALGLGMVSKYTMVLFPLCLLLWLGWEKKLKVLKTWQPWTALVWSAVVFSPVLIWNYQNHFASFGFQFNHGLGAQPFNWHWPLEYLGGQVGLLNPIIFVLACMATAKFWGKQKLLIVTATVPLLFFLLSSFKAHVEPNWPVCAYPSVVALAVCLPYRRWIKGALVLSAAFLITFMSHSIRPWLPIKKEKDHTKIMSQWVADVAALRAYSPLYARSYQLAAYYSYFRPQDKEVFKPRGMDRKDFYDSLPQPESYDGSYIVLDSHDILPPALNERYRLKEVMTLPSGFVLNEMKSK